MTLQIETGGRTRAVTVRRVDPGFEVIVDGHPHVADLVAVPAGWSLILDGRSYEIAVEEQRGNITVYVNGRAIPVAMAGAVARLGAGPGRGRAAPHAGGPQRIVTPMPGRIVKVLVKPGDTVTARQGLVVVEAMKMENELRAPGPGTVAEVRVTEGASVDANAVLIVIA